MHSAPTGDDARDPNLTAELSLSGRLTADDHRRAQALRDVLRTSSTSQRATFWGLAGVIFVALLIYLQPWNDGAPVAEADAAQHVAPMNTVFFALLGMASIAVPLLVLVLAGGVKLATAAGSGDFRAQPHQWLFRDDGFTLLNDSVVIELAWDGFTLLRGPDLIVFDHRDGDGHLFPRRFAADEATWQALGNLAARKLPAASRTPPKFSAARPDAAPSESVSFVERWRTFEFNTPPVAVGRGSAIAPEAIAFGPYFRVWLPLFAAYASAATAALVAFLLLDDARARTFCGVAAAANAVVLFGLASKSIRERRKLARRCDDAEHDVLTVRTNHVEFHGRRSRTILDWSRLQGTTLTPDAIQVTPIDARVEILLPRRLFTPPEWDRLAAKAAMLPKRGV